MTPWKTTVESARFTTATRPAQRGVALYGTRLDSLFVDALPVRYDDQAWQKQFLANWPPTTPAHESYFGRIIHGLVFDIAQAIHL